MVWPKHSSTTVAESRDIAWDASRPKALVVHAASDMPSAQRYLCTLVCQHMLHVWQTVCAAPNRQGSSSGNQIHNCTTLSHCAPTSCMLDTVHYCPNLHSVAADMSIHTSSSNNTSAGPICCWTTAPAQLATTASTWTCTQRQQASTAPAPSLKPSTPRHPTTPATGMQPIRRA